MPVGQSVGLSIRWSIGPSVHHTAFSSCLKVEKFRFEYFMDANALAQIITSPAQPNTAPAQLNTAPPQPPATGVVVYTALLIRNCSKTSKARRTGLIAIWQSWIDHEFLNATTHLYKTSCPSIPLSVGPSVLPSIPCYFQTTKDLISYLPMMTKFDKDLETVKNNSQMISKYRSVGLSVHLTFFFERGRGSRIWWTPRFLF